MHMIEYCTTRTGDVFKGFLVTHGNFEEWSLIFKQSSLPYY